MKIDLILAKEVLHFQMYLDEDADGVWQDLTLFDFANPSSQYTAITHRDRIEKRNDVLKEINVLKPDVIDKVVGEFNNFHKKVG